MYSLNGSPQARLPQCRYQGKREWQLRLRTCLYLERRSAIHGDESHRRRPYPNYLQETRFRGFADLRRKCLFSRSPVANYLTVPPPKGEQTCCSCFMEKAGKMGRQFVPPDRWLPSHLIQPFSAVELLDRRYISWFRSRRFQITPLYEPSTVFGLEGTSTWC